MPSIQRVDLGHTIVASDSAEDSPREVQANLRWHAGSTIVFTGALTSAMPVTLTVSLHFDAADMS